jgi:hypothetical protein
MDILRIIKDVKIANREPVGEIKRVYENVLPIAGSPKDDVSTYEEFCGRLYWIKKPIKQDNNELEDMIGRDCNIRLNRILGKKISWSSKIRRIYAIMNDGLFPSRVYEIIIHDDIVIHDSVSINV